MPPEPDREHLLAPPSFRPTPQSTRPPSIASVLSEASTLRAEVPVRSARRPQVLSDSTVTLSGSQTRPYRGYPSERAYLEALRAWVEERDYVQHDYSLIGFYGTKTAEHYKALPSLRSKPKDKADGRRATIAAPEDGTQQVENSATRSKSDKDGAQGEAEQPRRSRTKNFSNIFTRRPNVE